MPHLRHDQEGPDDRRDDLRREEDDERSTIIERAVQDAPIVRRLLKIGRVSVASIAFGGLLGGGGVEFGNRALAQRVDHQSLRIDSLMTVMGEMRRDIETVAFIQCVQLRRSEPDLRPKGCDEAEKRSAR